MHGEHAHGSGHDHEHGHEHGHGHSPYLEHHFETLGQQFESDKLGMWLFLATEILLFGGLFCAYSVYRGNHPEIFVYAHQYLNKMWGGINTVVLLLSSFTIAWSVRATQLGQRSLQIGLLVITLLCAFGFLGIKYVEYSEKWKHGLLPGKHYQPHVGSHGEEHAAGAEAGADHAAAATSAGGEHTAAATTDAAAADSTLSVTAGDHHASTDPAIADSAASAVAAVPAADPNDPLAIDPSKIAPAAAPPAGLAREVRQHEGEHGVMMEEPKNVQTFFAVYFVMTGLHGVHVVAGIIAIFVILIYSMRGLYKPEWFTPVDMVALYWHIVDLIWIFLFPLLYLIH
ncbi:cytochrome c oxidase subunit 3 [bacterium]|nr:cytochrome c oxidase subunit 3 [bacterium]